MNKFSEIIKNKKSWVMVLFSIYVLDFHKLIFNTGVAILGMQKQLGPYVNIVNFITISTVLFLVIFLLYFYHSDVIKIISKSKLAKIQLSLAFLYIVNLVIVDSSLFSISFVLKYFLANLLFFIIGYLIVFTKEGINIFMNVFLYIIILMSLVSFFFYMGGANYTSLRAKIIPGMDIRSGYLPSVYLIYIYITKISNIHVKNRKYWGMFSIFVFFGILVSGSKASVLLSFVLIFLYSIIFLKGKKINYKVIFGFALVIIIILSIIFLLDNGKNGANLFKVNEYYDSILSRIKLYTDYMIQGLKKPIFGNGIPVSYNLSFNRTHSLTSAFIVQLGIPGLLFHLTSIYLVISMFIKSSLLEKNNIDPYGNKIAFIFVFLFVVVFSEIAFDVIGNRLVWFFMGVGDGFFQSTASSKSVNIEEK